MKRKIIVVLTVSGLIISTLFFTQCSGSISDADNVTVSRYYTLTHDLFYQEYSITLFEFSQILDSITKIGSESDFSYLNGKIDGYFSRGTLAINLVQENSAYTKTPIISTELREPVFTVIKDMNDFLKKLKKVVLETKDKSKINLISSDLQQLSDLAKKINVNGSLLKDQNNSSEYKEIIQRMEKIISDNSKKLEK